MGDFKAEYDRVSLLYAEAALCHAYCPTPPALVISQCDAKECGQRLPPASGAEEVLHSTADLATALASMSLESNALVFGDGDGAACMARVVTLRPLIVRVDYKERDLLYNPGYADVFFNSTYGMFKARMKVVSAPFEPVNNLIILGERDICTYDPEYKRYWYLFAR